MTESQAWERLVAARRSLDAGGSIRRDLRPLALATMEWIRAAGLEAAIEIASHSRLALLVSAVVTLSDAMVAPASLNRSPSQALAAQAKAWERIREIVEGGK